MITFRFFCGLLLGFHLSYAKVDLQGQETWGGDSAALKFVKYGRLISYELETDKNCQIGRGITIQKWKDLIDRTNVESTENKKPSQSGHIYFELYKWWYLKKEWKAEWVLKEYAEQAGVKLSSQEIQKILKKCMKSNNLWARNSNPGHKTISVDTAEDIIQNSKELLGFIQSKKIKNLPPHFEIIEFEKLVNRLKKTNFEDSKKSLEIDISPISILFPQDTLKDAQNTVRGDFLSLKFNSVSWSQLSKGQKKELLFHELLGLMRLDDTNYQYSSKLMFDLDQYEYNKP